MAIATRCPILHFQVNPYHVFGVDAVKGPCAVFIFLFFFVACYLCVCWLGFGGGGVGGDVNVHCDCNHTVRSLALPHMLRCCTFSCTSTHTSCYAAGLHFHTDVMLRCCTFSCTSTHTSCYAAALHFHTDVMLRCCTFCECIKVEYRPVPVIALNNQNSCQAKFRVQWLS